MSQLSFKTWCIELYADHKSMPGHEVYALFEEKGVLQMLDEDYDLIHGLGFPFVIHEIEQFLAGGEQ
jgi:hypothetical protein